MFISLTGIDWWQNVERKRKDKRGSYMFVCSLVNICVCVSREGWNNDDNLHTNRHRMCVLAVLGEESKAQQKQYDENIKYIHREGHTHTHGHDSNLEDRCQHQQTKNHSLHQVRQKGKVF